MKKRIAAASILAFITLCIVVSCKHKPNAAPDYGDYPDNVARIITQRCAISGCHNQASYTAAGGLLMDTWDHMFYGGNNGAVVIPYSPEYSSLLYFINTAANNNGDLVNTPNMPHDENGTDPLTKDEYNTIKDWIAQGAPDRNGNIPFASNADTRQKIYMSQQGCDLIAVIDAERKVVMRYIKVGKEAGTESPHCVRVSPDGKYAYVSFINGQYLQKINTGTDQVELDAMLPAAPPGKVGQWNICYVSPNNDQVLVSDWRTDSREVLLNAHNLTLVNTYGGGTLQNPHGITSNQAFDTFFVTAQSGNVVYKIPRNGGSVTMVNLDGGVNPATTVSIPGVTPDPHEIMMVPDRSKYLITGQSTNDIRFIDAYSDKVLAKIPVGAYPQEIAISPKNHLVYISCLKDAPSGVFQGSIYVFDYNDYSLKGIINGKLAQPHGLTIDDQHNVLYVASQNTDGPAPHHATACAGRNGYYQVYSSVPPFTQLDNKTYEVSVQPYSCDVRFKQ